MARYQLRRPSPVKVFPRYARRQLPAVPVPEAEEEEEAEGPESPDSPGSSPSTVGALSEGEDSESEDEAEPPSPTRDPNAPPGIPPAPTADSSISFSLAAGTSEATSQTAALPASTAESAASATTTSTSTVTSAPPPAFTADITSQGNNAALPQITNTEVESPTTETSFTSTILVASSLISTQRPSLISSVVSSTSTDLPSPTSPTSTDAPTSAPTDLLSVAPTDLLASTSTDLLSSTPTDLPQSAQPENSGSDNAPQRQFPRPEPPIMTRGAAIAATVLGVLGALALIIGIIFLLKRRKRKQNAYKQQLSDDAFDPGNTGTLRAPETAHFDDSGPLFFKIRDADNHMTRSTERSNTLFGPGSYSRPETVSTERNNASRFPAPQPTPNPFADPPLNKAYDVLAGRPRSTTLTDRGSWIKNPFRNPESERFDPFGELQEKARQERLRYVDEARREAELIREYEEQERQFKEKEKMGLTPDGMPTRKGSGVTVEGLGVLDRTGGGSYR